jgi:two-component system, cell cycle sensor histidine kinase and response regulator CckA
MKKGNKETKASTLRRRAEKRLVEKHASNEPPPKNEDPLKLIHELQVHQIELEMQNEELMQARAETEAGLERYSDLYDFAPVGYFTLTDDGIIREVNLTGATLLGRERSLLINMRFDFFISDETQGAFFTFLRKVYESNEKESCEVMISRIKGNPRYVHIEGTAGDTGKNKDSQCLIAVLDITEKKHVEEELHGYRENLEEIVKERTAELERKNKNLEKEITERKRAEEALLKSAEEIRDLYNNAPCGYHSLDKNSVFVRINDTELNWLGYTREEIIGKMKFTSVLTEASKKTSRQTFPRFKEQGWINDLEFEMIRKNGTVMPVLLNATAIKDSNGSFIRSRSTLFDITERKKAEKELRESEQRFRSMFERHLAVMLLIDPDSGSIIDVNPAAAKFYGYSRTTLTTMNIAEINQLPPEEITAYRRQAEQENHNFFIFPHRLSNGVIRTVEVNASPIYSQGQVLLFSIVHDITERKKAEEEKKKLEMQLMQSQKMEGLGRFAGGIAHDLNNVLYPIIIDTELLLEETVPDTHLHQTLNQILKAAYRQRDMVRQILSFSRRSEQKFTPITVTPVLEETIALLKSSLPGTIKLKKHIDVHSDTILGDSTQVQQVIMNLFRNAADAIGSRRGTIEVRLENTSLESSAAHPEREVGQILKLMVKDTGHGMTKEVRDQIFEPFYTTKEIGKGSGMGLSVVYGILEKHGGTIAVESEPGKGSEFTVLLPITDEEIHTQSPSDNVLPVEEKMKVLLVDDEELILSSLKNALIHLGYDAVAVKSAREALEVFRTTPQTFNLVITDLTMPQITGVELAKKLMDIQTDIPIILCTGFNDVIHEDEAKAMGIRELLLKPSSIKELKTAISRALEN